MSDKRISTEAWNEGRDILKEIGCIDYDIANVLMDVASAWGLQPPRLAPIQPPVHLRAWLLDQEVMERVHKCEWEDGVIVEVYIRKYPRCYEVPEKAYVMLGSGLLDKHRTEIFVDDVICVDDAEYRVSYSDGEFWARPTLASGWTPTPLLAMYKGCKVGGNVRANPAWIESEGE